MKRVRATFQFKPFSPRQIKVLTWWLPNSPVCDLDGVIADGAIRSGKTVAMSLSFVMWAMETFNAQNLAMCGKTIGSFRRNVLFWLKLMLQSRGYGVEDRRSDNLLIVRRGKVENYFYIFGGKDERSQDLIQGITLAGVFFDEVALMPQSFVNQATGRCSVEGSKFWFNCNPDNPNHWFHQEWILKYVDKRLLYLHFTMDDNWSLSEKIKERYRAMYSGAFFQRFILGLWVAAEGVIYRLFADDPEKYIIDEKPDIIFSTIGGDFGGNKSAHAFNCTGFERGMRAITTLDEFHSKEPYTPTELEAEFVKFVKKQIDANHRVTEIFLDSAEQVLIRGFKNALVKAGIQIPVRNALKGEVNERIRFYLLLIGAGRYHIMRHCTHTIDAFQTALWNPKKLHDERLDDGTTNIDTLDGQEYGTEKYQKQLIDMIILGR